MFKSEVHRKGDEVVPLLWWIGGTKLAAVHESEVGAPSTGTAVESDTSAN